MALPNFRCSIFKMLGAEEWSNDWLLNVTDMAEAVTVATALVNFERQLHHASVGFSYYRLATMAEGDRTFRHVALNQVGALAIGTNQFLPLYCTLRLDMSTADSDPCRKYFRSPVAEGWQSGGIIDATTIANLQASVVTHFNNSVAMDNVVSGRGNVVTGATLHPQVQMRQLHRRRRPKVV